MGGCRTGPLGGAAVSKVFQGWTSVAAHLDGLAQGATMVLNEGQRWSLRKIAERLPESGLVLADEVGMGKTRIASAVANAVIAAGGRVAVLGPVNTIATIRRSVRSG